MQKNGNYEFELMMLSLISPLENFPPMKQTKNSSFYIHKLSCSGEVKVMNVE